MRVPQLVLAVAGTLMCTGCSELISLHPFVSDKEAVQDARLLGVWADEDDTYLVRQDGGPPAFLGQVPFSGVMRVWRSVAWMLLAALAGFVVLVVRELSG